MRPKNSCLILLTSAVFLACSYAVGGSEEGSTPRSRAGTIVRGTARPMVRIGKADQVLFNPATVALSDRPVSEAKVNISASPACEFDGCLQAGDRVLIEIDPTTAGGDFEYSPGQEQEVELNLGNPRQATFEVRVKSKTSSRKYGFIVAILDVKHADGTSFTEKVQLEPETASVSGDLSVTK